MNNRQTLSTLLGLIGAAMMTAASAADIINVPGAQTTTQATLPDRPDLDSTGSDTDQPLPRTQASIAIGGACEILWFGTDFGSTEISRFQSLGFNITHTLNPADVNPANLSNFDVLVVTATGAGVLGGAQPDIEAYVNGGNGLLIHQPNVAGGSDYAPTNFNVTTDPLWCNFPSDFAATIVDPSHPITTGLTDVDLAGDFDFVVFIGSGYTLLAENVVCADPALAAGTSGSGRVVFETGNASNSSTDAGSDQYWINVLTWLCEAEPGQDCSNFPCGNNDNKVLLCHVPPGNPENAHTICISPNAVAAHIEHHEGDHCGPCAGGQTQQLLLPCPWDLDSNGSVATEDLLALLAAWGTDSVGPTDFDANGNVGTEDLLELLANWGPCPSTDR